SPAHKRDRPPAPASQHLGVQKDFSNRIPGAAVGISGNPGHTLPASVLYINRVRPFQPETRAERTNYQTHLIARPCGKCIQARMFARSIPDQVVSYEAGLTGLPGSYRVG